MSLSQTTYTSQVNENWTLYLLTQFLTYPRNGKEGGTLRRWIGKAEKPGKGVVSELGPSLLFQFLRQLDFSIWG
jgi:hypothetical protein